MSDYWIDDIEKQITKNRWNNRASIHWEEGKQRQHEIEQQIDNFEQSLRNKQLPSEWNPMDEGINNSKNIQTYTFKQSSLVIPILLFIIMLCFVIMAILQYIIILNNI